MIRFGPAGNSEIFFEEGHKSSLEALAWLKKRGLSAYEYPFTRGINMSEELAKKLGQAAKENGIEISVHAPYYINFAGNNPDLLEKSYGYVIKCLHYLKLIGGKRCVFHPGTCGKMKREDALKLLRERITELVKRVRAAGFGDMYICPETMGKHGQLGTYQEIAELCAIDECLLPAVDFGHINAFEGGSLKTEADFKRVVDEFIAKIGLHRTRKIHIHFSKIEYGGKGEVRHLTFEDKIFGPEFEPLSEVLKQYNMEPVIICESNGTQAEDAMQMKKIYEELR
ncbi:MAG: TIM barrel protein [Christensenellaceae bacterium]|jgi:deoxyribonuclease-4|nr:TIM barrel protein [Christensenellaceae bacterium]